MTEPAEYCPCGRKLHYTDANVRAYVESTIVDLGPTVDVTVAGDEQRYRVSRHYIALHGLKAAELPSLKAKGIVQAAQRDGR